VDRVNVTLPSGLSLRVENNTQHSTLKFEVKFFRWEQVPWALTRGAANYLLDWLIS